MDTPKKTLSRGFFNSFISLLNKSIPYRFEPYHKKITRPFNYYQFGLDFIRPFIDFKQSSLNNPHILNQIETQIEIKKM